MPPSSWKLLLGFTDFFAAGFGLIYLLSSITVFVRFCHKRRLCRMDNCAFYIFTVGIFILSGLGIEYTQKAAESHEADFDASCPQLLLNDGISPDSFLAEANTVYNKANDLLCSSECPCALRGEVNDENRRQLRVFKDANGPTSVPKCTTFEQSVYGNDDDKVWQFTELLAELEDVHSCAGICNNLDEKPFDYYLFSNINDGVPQRSCKKAIGTVIEDHIAYFQTIYTIIYIISASVMVILVLLIICQTWLYCRNKCKGNKNKPQRQRAANGMVLGQDDADGEDGDVEVASAEKKPADAEQRDTRLPPKELQVNEGDEDDDQDEGDKQI